MGQASRIWRGERFIKEFNEDYKKMGHEAPFVTSQSLGARDGDDCVRYYYSIQFPDGKSEELCEDFVYYDPDWDVEQAVEVISINLETSKEEVRARLAKADLL